MADRLRVVTARIVALSRVLELDGPDADRFARTAGPRLKDEVATAARAAFGSDLKPFERKGARAGYGYDVDRAPRGVRLTFKLRPGGVWAFGEHGAGPHLIGGGRNFRRGTNYRSANRARAKTQGRNVKYVKGAGYAHPVRAPILHPGTKGKGAIRYAFKRVRQAQRDAVADGIRAVIRTVEG